MVAFSWLERCSEPPSGQLNFIAPLSEVKMTMVLSVDRQAYLSSFNNDANGIIPAPSWPHP